MEILKNPLIRIVGIIAIIYFALFHDKTNENSLRNRLSPERVKANMEYMKNQGLYIKQNMDKANSYEAQENQNNLNNNIETIPENEEQKQQ